MAAGIDRIGALRKAFEFVYKSETRGDYYEFGVFQGVSLARAIKADVVWRSKSGASYIENFFGFDSFEGLPQFIEGDHLNDYEVFKPSQFSDTQPQLVLDNITKEGLSVERVSLISGFYSESLKCDSTLKMVKNSKVAIAHIDCDLYSSAVDCLDFLNERLCDGAVVLFDDWFCYRGRPGQGVHKAFNEWKENSGFIVSEYFNYSWAGKAFIVNKPSGASE